MKKRLMIIFLTLVLVLVVIGCRSLNNSSEEESNNEISEGEIQPVEFTTEITELEEGLSVVKYEGEYYFDDFLENGGASSDKNVVEFLSKKILLGSVDIEFEQNIFACSTLSVETPDGDEIFGRNFDWQECDTLIVNLNPTNGYKSISTVNMDFITSGVGSIISKLPDNIITKVALYAPLDGMNEKGLAVAVNMIEDNEKIEQDTDKPDITTTTAIRLLLDNAANVEDAINLLNQFDMNSSMGMMIHFALSDLEGNSVVIEYVNNEMVVTETPVVTNFYLAEGDKNGIGSSQSHSRYEILMNSLENKMIMTLDEVRDAMDSVSKDNFEEFESTEWTALFNKSKGEVHYYYRENYDKGYLLSIE